METLDDIYNNINIDDNTILMRILNTIITDDDGHYEILENILYFVKYLDKLLIKYYIVRDDIKYVVSQIKFVENNKSFYIFCDLLDKIIDSDKTINKNIFLLCYCRSLWEIIFNKHIIYTNPKYSSLEAINGEYWNVFLQAYKDKQFKYLN